MSDDVKSKISELEKELYSKDFKAHRVGDILKPKEVADVPTWGRDGDSEPDEVANILKRQSMMKKFVKFSIGFFIFAVAVAAFIWWSQSNIVSGGNIAIEISAPVAISGGDPFDTTFNITNTNKVAVEAATLLIEYPVGFYSVSNNAELPRLSKELGAIAPGQSVKESISTLLYGEENTNKVTSITLEYRMAGSNATLKKTTSYSVKIASSPINVKLAVPKEMSSGQEVELTVDIGSNSKDPLGALVVDAVYPLGFTFESAVPAPTYGNSTWRIPSLAPQEKRTIKIIGVIEGQESEEKITKISVGTENPKDERLIGVVYNAATESSTVTKPVIGIDVAINNVKSQENVAALNKGVRVDVFWQNNNPTRVSDITIEVKLKGSVLDKYSLYASGGGFYRSIDNTIVWSKTSSHELAAADPDAKGTVSFSFSPISLGVDSGRLVKNPQIIFEVRAGGVRVSDVSSSEKVSTFISRNVKFETDLKLAAKGLFFSGPFQNTGPIPPQADRETTYTVSMSARNSANNTSNVIAKTTLPIYVKWTGKVSPDGEDISFNENTGEVSWNVGRIPSGGSRDASFQISLMPSLSHLNLSPALTGDFSLSATDDFTKTEVSDKRPALTTYISGDPQFSSNDANVVN